jgi:putative membrane protein
MKIDLETNKKEKSQVFSFRNVSLFFIIFYLVGFLGILFPQTRPLFIWLTPFAIVLSLIAFLLFHESKISIKLIVALLLIYFLGYFIEIVGVNTGSIFGHYRYSSGLGIKVWNTPLFIGLNWVMLIYASSSVLSNTTIHPVFKTIISSSFMLIYDLILEQIAPKMDMWYWKDNCVPLQNYIAWFIIAIAFHSIFQLFGISTKNKMAPIIFSIQTVFFFSLTIYFYLTK